MHIKKSIMLGNVIWFVTILILIDTTRSIELLNYDKLYSFAKTFHLDQLISTNTTDNELWHGLLKDCKKKVTFSCIQKNAYSYLDDTFSDKYNNITIFDGLTLTKNNLNYGTCKMENKRKSIDDNLIDDSIKTNCEFKDDEDGDDKQQNDANSGTRRRGRIMMDEQQPKSPLEEITDALRHKAMKFLVTRDYEIQLPKMLFEGTTMKISPRQIDDTGALIRLDFTEVRGVSNEGRIFKKIKKFIQNKLLFSFIALILIIKLIKVKFLFVIPFLFGVGAAKKLFLKLLLFLIPPFAHIFKLCSSFYTSHGPKYHHHHHQIAHHHHHVPVPVPVPAYYDHHHHHHDDDLNGYDYSHPHIQYRKDVEELKEWGIEPYDDLYDDTTNKHVPGVLPASLMNNPISTEYATGTNYNNPYGIPQYAANVRPVVVSPSTTYNDKYPISISAHAHNLAYSGYLDDKYNRRVVEPNGISTSVKSVNNLPGVQLKQPINNIKKNTYGILNQANVRQTTIPRINKSVATSKNSIVSSSSNVQTYDDDYYGPIMNRLEEIFAQLRFFDESCRERLICSMYKNPTVYSPHSNLVSNELSRDPQELKRGTLESASSQKFHKYLSAARIGQDHGDCVRTYPCHINTE